MLSLKLLWDTSSHLVSVLPYVLEEVELNGFCVCLTFQDSETCVRVSSWHIWAAEIRRNPPTSSACS